MKWTEEQIKIIRQYAGKITSSEIGAMLGRHAQSVRDKMCILGIKANPNVSYNKWTPEQTEILRANVGRLSSPAIAKLVGLSKSAVCGKIRALGLTGIAKCHPNVWSAEQLAKLKLLETGSTTLAQLAQEFGFGKMAISYKARALGYKVQRGDGWRKHEDELIREFAGKMSAEEIGKQIGRSKCSVHSRASRLKINMRTDGKPTRKESSPRGPRQSKPKTKIVRITERIVRPVDICPKHRCPVSNWEEHRKRLNCDVIPPYLADYSARLSA